jgi:hypothetical protein
MQVTGCGRRPIHGAFIIDQVAINVMLHNETRRVKPCKISLFFWLFLSFFLSAAEEGNITGQAHQ